MSFIFYTRIQLVFQGVTNYSGYRYEFAILNEKGKIASQHKGVCSANGQTSDTKIIATNEAAAKKYRVYYDFFFDDKLIAKRVAVEEAVLLTTPAANHNEDIWPTLKLTTIPGTTEMLPDTVPPQKITVLCYCQREFTAADLVSFGIPKTKANLFLEALNETMARYEINTCRKKLHFLAQIRHESADFIYQRELADGKAYENRNDLGNVNVGDGVRFKGRGLIQITGRTNYHNYGQYVGKSFLMEPDNLELERIPYCVDSAGWFWSKNLNVDLNDYADQDDLIYCTYRINGGFNGYTDRLKQLQKMFAKSKCNYADLSLKVYKFSGSACANLETALKRWGKRT